MNNINEERILYLVEKSGFDEKMVRFIIHRYGLGTGNPATIQELSKLYKLRGKKLEEKIKKADKIIFNVLKNENLYDIIIQSNQNEDGEGR